MGKECPDSQNSGVLKTAKSIDFKTVNYIVIGRFLTILLRFFRLSSSPKDIAYGCSLDELKKATIQLAANWHKVVDFTWTRALAVLREQPHSQFLVRKNIGEGLCTEKAFFYLHCAQKMFPLPPISLRELLALSRVGIAGVGPPTSKGTFLCNIQSLRHINEIFWWKLS